MKKKKLWLLYPVLALLLAFSVVVPAPLAHAQVLPLPHNFYGSLTIGTEPALAGRLVEARGEGVMTIEGNPITTTNVGEYGGPGPTDPKLKAMGYIDEGTPIEFYVDGMRAQCRVHGTLTWLYSYPWHSDGLTELDLRVGEAPEEYSLTIDSTAGGEVTEPGEGVFPGYAPGTVVDLLAVPDAGFLFLNWTGDTGTIDDVNAEDTFITMNGNYSITANFGEIGVTYDLTVDSTTGGEVTEPGEGVFPDYDAGTAVNLLAVPDAGYQFLNWTGDTGTIDNVNTEDTFITMNGNYSITANFALIGITYNLTVASTAGGIVTEPGEGVFPYLAGTVVDLLAVPDVCAYFINWTGDTGTIDDVLAADTFITMNGNYSITANFVPPEVLMYIELGAGWNTFSTPIALDPCSNTWDGLLALSELDDVEMLYYYNGSTQYWGLVTTGHEVKPLEGFFVKLSDESLGGAVPIIPHPESPVPPSKEVYTGLNLVGPAPASLVDEDVIFNLATIYEAEGGLLGYSMVISPPIHTPDDWVYMRDDPDPPLMEIGNAYWVTMENPDTLFGSSSTPIGD